MSLSKTLQTKLDAIVTQFADHEGTINLTVDELMAAFASKPKKVVAKRPRDPTKPKAPPTAFKQWKANEGDEIRQDLDRESGEPMSKHEFNAYLSQMWEDMTDDEKSAYNILYALAQDTYKDELKAWKAEKGVVTKPIYKKFNTSVTPPKAPKGWSAPQAGYIEGSPIDPNTGKKFTKGFKTLEEAIQKADELGANGITRTRVGYRIRIGSAVSSTETSRVKEEFSWIRK
jgi:hypothetical protein